MKKQLLIFFVIIGLGSYQLNAQNETFTANSGTTNVDAFWGNTENWTNSTLATGVATVTTNADLTGGPFSLATVKPTGTNVEISNGTLQLGGATNAINVANANVIGTFNCNVTLTADARFRNNGTDAQLILASGNTLDLDTYVLSINNQKTTSTVVLDGTVIGTGGIVMINGELTLGSNSDFTGFTGNYTNKDKTITSNTTSVFINAASSIDLDGTGELTVGGENTIEGDVNRISTNTGTSTVTFNANQNNMGNLSVDTQALALDFGGATDVRFSGYTTSTTEGVVDLINYTSGELRIGTTATSVPPAVLSTWLIGGAGAGTVTQDADGYIIFGACTVDVVTTPVATAGAEYIDLSWVDPTCFDEVLVVAKEGSAVTFTTPTGDGSLYTADADFGTIGTDTNIAASEFAVFKGAADKVIVSKLTKSGTTYHFAVFTRKGTDWSAGVIVSATTNDTYTSIDGANNANLVWEDKASWIGEAVPSATSDDVMINAGLIINSNVELNDIVITKRVTVKPGYSLEVNNVTINQLVVESTSTAFASLIVNGTSTGNIIYDRWVNETPGNDLISSPVMGTVGNFYTTRTNNALLTSGTTNAFGPFNNVTGKYENYDTVTDVSEPLVTGKGYRAAAISGGDEVRFSQAPLPSQTTPLTIDITDGGAANGFGAWNLIGNPYPSYLIFTDFFNLVSDAAGGGTNNQLDAAYTAVYGYNGAATGNKWEVYNALNLPPDGKIAPGQGFFVRTIAATTGTVTFTPAMRTIGTGDDFLSGKEKETKSLNIALAKLNLSSVTNTYSTDIYFVENQTRGLDPGYDAGAYAGSTSGIYTNLVENNTGIDMAIQALPYNDFNDVVVPLGIKSDAGVELTIGLDVASASIPSNVKVYLEDNVANTWTLLNAGDYVFTPSVELNGTGRFFVHFSSVTLSTEQSVLNGLNIYTDKASKAIVIKGQLTNNTTATIYDIQGRVVLQRELESSNTTNRINVNTLNTGIYIIQLENNSQSRTQKVIIN